MISIEKEARGPKRLVTSAIQCILYIIILSILYLRSSRQALQSALNTMILEHTANNFFSAHNQPTLRLSG